MSNTNFTKRSPMRWIVVTRWLMVLGLLCFLYSGSLYYSVFFHEANRASRAHTRNVGLLNLSIVGPIEYLFTSRAIA